MTDADFFPLDLFMRKPDAPDAQEVADRTGLTLICDEDAAAAGADCWHATLVTPEEAAAHYVRIGGTVSRIYAPTLSDAAARRIARAASQAQPA